MPKFYCAVFVFLFLAACSFNLDMNCKNKIDYSGTWAHTDDVCTGLGTFLCNKKSDSTLQFVQFIGKDSIHFYFLGRGSDLPMPLPDSIAFDSAKFYVFHLKLIDGYGGKYIVVKGTQRYFGFDCGTLFYSERSNPPEMFQNPETGESGYTRGNMKSGFSKLNRGKSPLQLPSYWPKDSTVVNPGDTGNKGKAPNPKIFVHDGEVSLV